MDSLKGSESASGADVELSTYPESVTRSSSDPSLPSESSNASVAPEIVRADGIDIDAVAIDVAVNDPSFTNETFVNGLFKKDPQSTSKRRVKRFYKEQNQFVDEIYQILDESDGPENDRKITLRDRIGEVCSYEYFCLVLSFASNFLIFCVKLAAAISSGSLALLASTIDSSLDLVSGTILFIANRIRRRKNARDYIRYPLGKSRLEPVAYIIFACIVCTATSQVALDSIKTIFFGVLNQIQGNLGEVPFVDNSDWTFWFSTGTLVFVACFKLILHLICRPSKSLSVQAYAQDHRNDVIFNTILAIAVSCSSLSDYVWWLDPLAALGVSIFILQGWIRGIVEYVQKMVGCAADSKTITKLTHLVFNHDNKILYIDTVRASYVGLGLWVEVDIVLPEDMPLKEAHDIGESLQKKLESQEDVERAWVHLDHEFDHSPHSEHKKPE